jgi:hypothetical protein
MLALIFLCSGAADERINLYSKFLASSHFDCVLSSQLAREWKGELYFLSNCGKAMAGATTRVY